MDKRWAVLGSNQRPPACKAGRPQRAATPCLPMIERKTAMSRALPVLPTSPPFPGDSCGFGHPNDSCARTVHHSTVTFKVPASSVPVHTALLALLELCRSSLRVRVTADHSGDCEARRPELRLDAANVASSIVTSRCSSRKRSNQRAATRWCRRGALRANRSVSSSASARLIRPISFAVASATEQGPVLERPAEDGAGVALRGRRSSSLGPNGRASLGTRRRDGQRSGALWTNGRRRPCA